MSSTGVLQKKFKGDEIPREVIEVGSIFFSKETGFGIIVLVANNKGLCYARAVTIKGMAALICKDNRYDSPYRLKPNISREEYLEGLTPERRAERIADENAGRTSEANGFYVGFCGETVEQVAFLGVLELKRMTDDKGNIVEGCADSVDAGGQLTTFTLKFFEENLETAESKLYKEIFCNGEQGEQRTAECFLESNIKKFLDDVAEILL